MLRRSIAVALASLPLAVSSSQAQGGLGTPSPVVHRPKLVIVLVIDQFRADYLLRFENRFVPARAKNGDVGGFEYLMSQGAYYPMAEYGVLQSMTCPGHATILTGSYPYQAGIPPGLYGEQLMHTYFPGRSGDVIIIPKPYWMVDGGDAVTHLNGYSYDRMVPLVIAGAGVRAGVHPEYARVIDLAPTLSYLLGILPPSLSEGRVLTEALSAKAGVK